ncbi:FAD-dependent oxidoreductase [Kitasatospora sp. NPDC058965]|uniref:FAD-dependent oxidoreductase n=1 Tax=Kitasatospora sp. NPDC058965 TaxID=3346682 RepID=UPI0036C17AE4
MESSSSPRTQATVVGAGPYGLAIAAHLRARGIEPRVFGETMESWQARMPAGMYLKSTPSASSIAGPAGRGRLEQFRAEEGRPGGEDRHPVPIAEFIDYGRWFQSRWVPDVAATRVIEVARDPAGGFQVTLDDGERFASATVVLATGLGPYAHVPADLAPLVEAGVASHSADHHDLGTFAGKRVLVLGAGQSGLETAALLHESGAEPVLVARTDRLLFGDPPATDRPADRPLPVRLAKPGSPLGPGWSLLAFAQGPAAFRYLPERTRTHFVRTVLGPSGAWWLRERVAGRFPQLTGYQPTAGWAEDGQVRLELRAVDGGTGVPRSVAADHLICATGYRIDLRRLELLSPSLRALLLRDGPVPRLRAGFESAVPGLYFAGLSAAPSFGPVLRFVCGTGFAARRISAAVARG